MASEEMSFENVDDGRTDGRWIPAYEGCSSKSCTFFITQVCAIGII